MSDIYDAGFNKLLTRETAEEDSSLPNQVQPSQLIAGSLDFGKIQILPDETTGLVARDDDDGEVFKIISGGDNIGDVIMGDSAGQHAKWDKSASTFSITGTVTATAGAIGGWTINATSIYTGTEDHNGYTANAGDLTIYSDGTDASIHAKNFYIDASGNLMASAGTITGATVQSNSAANTGVKMTASGIDVYGASILKCYTTGGVEKGYLGSFGGTSYMTIYGDPDLQLSTADGAGDIIIYAGDLLPNADNYTSFGSTTKRLKKIWGKGLDIDGGCDFGATGITSVLTGHWEPSADTTSLLGGSTKRWLIAYLYAVSSDNGTSPIYCDANWVPNGDNGFDLGSPSYEWKDLFIDGTVQTDALRIDQTPTAETPSATHTVVINMNGTNYKFLCLAA